MSLMNLLFLKVKGSCWRDASSGCYWVVIFMRLYVSWCYWRNNICTFLSSYFPIVASIIFETL